MYLLTSLYPPFFIHHVAVHPGAVRPTGAITLTSVSFYHVAGRYWDDLSTRSLSMREG